VNVGNESRVNHYNKTLNGRGSGVEIAGGNGKSKMDSSGTTTTILKHIRGIGVGPQP